MEIFENYSLKELNTFGIEVRSKYFVTVTRVKELPQVLTAGIVKNENILILGSGSNILFTKDYAGLVINNQIYGLSIAHEDAKTALVSAGSGVIWQDLVEFSLAHNLGGIENLSLIPGTVGAAPMQNIGAYGVELKDVIHSLEAYNLSTGLTETFTKENCEFGYRNSIFKNKLKGKYFITKVYLNLSKQPQVNTSYGAIAKVLEAKKIVKPTIQDVSQAVIEIRQSKLPDPTKIGNAGSFFKNPVIDEIDFEGLKLSFPDIPGYINSGQVKIPAAWLIDQCGWKGKRVGAVGVHDKQPLVLVNHGGGTGIEIKKLAEDIQHSVAKKFGILLEPEPRIV